MSGVGRTFLDKSESFGIYHLHRQCHMSQRMLSLGAEYVNIDQRFSSRDRISYYAARAARIIELAEGTLQNNHLIIDPLGDFLTMISDKSQ